MKREVFNAWDRMAFGNDYDYYDEEEGTEVYWDGQEYAYCYDEQDNEE